MNAYSIGVNKQRQNAEVVQTAHQESGFLFVEISAFNEINVDNFLFGVKVNGEIIFRIGNDFRVESQKRHSSIVLYDENWKKGVIGIVASRLTEIYSRPTIVLTRENDLATGSARSVTGFDVYSAIKSCRDMLTNFGGHTYAAGLTLKWKDVPEFRKRFQKYVDEHILPEQTEAMLDIDAMIDFKDITKKLHTDIKKLGPFGPMNPKPLFCTTDVYDFGTSKVVGREQEHIKLELVDSKSNNVMNGIAFGQSGSARYIKSKRSFDIAYTIEDNVFKHNGIQLQIEDIRPSEE